MRRTNKKGFTIVELVIVIAVIAILAAVLIPTFASLVDKANQSADIQAVRQMNTALAACVDAPNNIADAKIILAGDGIDANNYKPLSSGYEFFWDPGLNRIVMVDESNVVFYPEDLKDKASADKWVSLSGNGNKSISEAWAKDAGSQVKIALTGTTNLSGASINLKPTATTFTIAGESSSSPATITNLVSDEGSRVATNEGYWAKVNYNPGMISTVGNGQTVTVENIIIDGAVVGDTTQPESARVGIIAGTVQTGGKLIIKNVTIRNCVVFGEYGVGALVGNVDNGGCVEITNVIVENTVVRACAQGASLIGLVYEGDNTMVSYTDVTTNNVTLEMSDYNNAGNAYGEITTNEAGDKNIKNIDGHNYAYLTEKYAWYLKSDKSTTVSTSDNIADTKS